MKKIFTILVLFLVFSTAGVKAQSYKTGFGLKLGDYSQGLTLKHFVKKNAALEGILSSRWHGVNIAGLYEVHGNAFNEPGFNWFIGGGAHASFYDHGYYYFRGHYDGYYDSYYYDRSRAVIGVDGVLGLEYTFRSAPINIGVDWKPEINFINNGFIANDIMFAVRYAFK
ncbi:hypothetical protein [Solitalea koreensis]|nr:hypothetical protein [Solitalea koreensis]